MVVGLGPEIVKSKDDVSTQPVTTSSLPLSYMPTNSASNRLLAAYMLITLLIILIFAIPANVQHDNYLDIIFKSLLVFTLSYVGYVTITKDLCAPN